MDLPNSPPIAPICVPTAAAALSFLLPVHQLSPVVSLTALAAATFVLGFSAGYFAARLSRPQNSVPAGPPRLVVTQLLIYPIKSCAAISLPAARVTRRGLENDRLFMLISPDRRSLTQKRYPSLARIRPSFEHNALVIAADGRPPYRHSIVTDGEPVLVTHLKDQLEAVDQGEDVAHFFQAALGLEGVRMVRMRDGFVRGVDPRFVRPGFETSMSDGWPYLLASEASLAALSAHVGRELEMRRFRPNVVVGGVGKGVAPFEEDCWKVLRVGSRVVFELVSGCVRCKVVTVDPGTGVMDGDNQPTVALKEIRAFGKRVIFGQNMIAVEHDGERAVVRVGDPVFVTETSKQGPVLVGSRGKA